MRTDKEILEQGLYRLLNNSIFRYQKFARGFEIIDNQELFLSKPSQLNDPFDCYEGLINFKMTKEFVESEMRPYLKLRGIARSNRKALELELLKNKSHNTFNEFFKEYKELFGICCFSWKNDNIVLWANYADNHQGISLGFRFLTPVNSKWGIYPIFYTPEVRKYTFSDFNDEKYWQHWLTTKAKDWEYEDEVRLISKSHNGLLKFSTEVLTEIYLGFAMTYENQNRVIDSLKRNNFSNKTKLYKMAIDKKNFRLIPKEIRWDM